MARGKPAVIVLAAGLGTRMKSDLPKVMHRLAGQPMLRHVLDAVETLDPAEVVVIVGPDMPMVEEISAPHTVVVQAERLGTGHAVRQAKDALKDFTGDVLVVYGDTPFLTAETMNLTLDKRAEMAGPGVVVLGFRPGDPAPYGRLIGDGTGTLEAIVEARDATEEQLAINLCNSGVMAADGPHLFELLGNVGNDNAKGEYYLTDIVGLAHAQGHPCAYVEGEETEMLGINSRRDLAAAERIIQNRLREQAMDNGATLIAPDTVYFSLDTKIGRDVIIGPNVIFARGVTVDDGVTIKGFCHFEGAHIAKGAQVGPYARLRPGAEIGPDSHIGNFVEVKNSTVEEGAKVNHLSYIGDGRVGVKANIGAGTIFCNYDGFTKNRTDVGDGAFVGSNSALVAPVTINAGAVVGAGSVITKDVSEDALALARGTQVEMPGWAAKFRARKKAEKEAKDKK